MRSVDRPSAKQLVQLLDWNSRLGIDTNKKKKLGPKISTLPCYNEFIM